jgi:hypothetical protein
MKKTIVSIILLLIVIASVFITSKSYSEKKNELNDLIKNVAYIKLEHSKRATTLKEFINYCNNETEINTNTNSVIYQYFRDDEIPLQKKKNTANYLDMGELTEEEVTDIILSKYNKKFMRPVYTCEDDKALITAESNIHEANAKLYTLIEKYAEELSKDINLLGSIVGWESKKSKLLQQQISDQLNLIDMAIR